MLTICTTRYGTDHSCNVWMTLHQYFLTDRCTESQTKEKCNLTIWMFMCLWLIEYSNINLGICCHLLVFTDYLNIFIHKEIITCLTTHPERLMFNEMIYQMMYIVSPFTPFIGCSTGQHLANCRPELESILKVLCGTSGTNKCWAIFTANAVPLSLCLERSDCSAKRKIANFRHITCI